MKNVDDKIRVIAEAWIECQKSTNGPEESNKKFWAYKELDDMTEDEPVRALEVIEYLCSITDDIGLLANISAGPLEDLLVRNGQSVIENICDWASNDMKAKRVLASVWRNNISQSIWDKILTTTKGVEPF